MIDRTITGDKSHQFCQYAQNVHIDPELPFSIWSMGDYTCDGDYWHKRDNFDLGLMIYTLEGEGFMEYQGRRHHILPGEVFVLNCNNYQYYGTVGKQWRFLWIHFQGTSAFHYIDLLNGNDAHPIFLGKRLSFENYYQRILQQSMQSTLRGELQATFVLQELFNELILFKKNDSFLSRYSEFQSKIEASLTYIKEHFSEDISIKNLSDICSLSEDYFIRVFKSYVEQTPYEYLINYRLQRAQQLLLESRKTVGEIALETGFGSSKHFVSCFKNKIGSTPLQFRKKSRF